MSKSIILFYSFEENTKKVAEFLSKELNIPSEEIKPVKDLKSKGFSKYFWGGQQVIMNRKPDLNEIKANLDDYDTVFLGSPIWAGTFAPAIKTLLEDGILKEKKVKFFYTHDGGPGKAENKIKEAVSINNTFVSAYGLARVKDGLEPLKAGLSAWAKDK
nr:NAD(P)H-dependent oxidoreductase [Tissierella sp.]